jgi:hypothetical protein
VVMKSSVFWEVLYTGLEVLTAVVMKSSLFWEVLYTGREVLRPVVMKSSLFWDITPCNPLKVNRRFGGTCHLRL